jgi:hypothetical protein
MKREKEKEVKGNIALHNCKICKEHSIADQLIGKFYLPSLSSVKMRECGWTNSFFKPFQNVDVMSLKRKFGR